MIGSTNAVEDVNLKKSINYIEYIESTGTQYIDTEYIPNINNNTKVVARYSYTTVYQYKMLAGFDYGAGFCYGMLDANAYFCNWCKSQKTTNIKPVVGQIYTLEQTYKNGSQNLTLNGVSRLNTTFDFNYTPYAIYIFGRHMSSGAALLSDLKLYSLQIYDNDVLVRDFVPILDKNNVACLYDKVSEKCFYNKGTGTFNAGAII